MNAHQRRIHVRARHMLLPLSKEIDTRQLMGRRVYVYGRSEQYLHVLNASHQITSARTTRHVKPFNKVDLDLTSALSDKVERVCVAAHGLRVKNVLDRAARPWWADTARKHKAARKV